MIDPELLLQGYRLGVFPMAMENGAIEWFSPDPRAILPLEDFHVPHALRGLLRKKIFETKIDTAFSDVIEACAKREDTWINREIIESYIQLHKLGYARSVEAWTDGKLAGGLYGVAIGGAFFGESMFHRVTDASKIAICSNSAASKFRGTIICDSCAEQSNCRGNSRPQICRRRFFAGRAARVLKTSAPRFAGATAWQAAKRLQRRRRRRVER